MFERQIAMRFPRFRCVSRDKRCSSGSFLGHPDHRIDVERDNYPRTVCPFSVLLTRDSPSCETVVARTDETIWGHATTKLHGCTYDRVIDGCCTHDRRVSCPIGDGDGDGDGGVVSWKRKVFRRGDRGVPRDVSDRSRGSRVVSTGQPSPDWLVPRLESTEKRKESTTLLSTVRRSFGAPCPGPLSRRVISPPSGCLVDEAEYQRTLSTRFVRRDSLRVVARRGGNGESRGVAWRGEARRCRRRDDERRLCVRW